MQYHAQDPQQTKLDAPVVVVGAGAAGLMAAIFAARGGARVLILETRRQPGAKIRVSGGSRCNVMPSQVALEDFHSSGSAHSLRNILFSWPLAEVNAFFHSTLGVPLKTEATGKVFPQSDRSKDVVDALLREAQRLGVVLRGESRVTDMRCIAPGGGWALRLHDGTAVAAQAVILATGGLSLPKTGSDGAGWRMARGVGHSTTATYPALVPLLTEDAGLRALAGVALPVCLQAQHHGKTLARYTGDFLFTHAGFSGPAVLNVSRFVAAPDGAAAAIGVRWGQVESWQQVLHESARKRLAACVREHLPRRLADALLQRAGVADDRPVSELRRPERARLLAQLEGFVLPVSGNEGYRTAEVTAGGVPLGEVHTRSLESRVAPRLYLAGEMLDVVGKLGGYNFLWAWVSGRRAGAAAAQAVIDF